MIKTVITITFIIAVSNCTITILTPPGLAERFSEPIEYVLANYGKIPYGKSFIGTLYISDPIDGCGDISPKQYDDNSNGDSDNFGDSKKIYLIERGNCSFITKSRNAQKADGKIAMIFNNNKSQGLNDILLMDQYYYSEKGLMLSTIFVSYSTGEILQDYIKDNKEKEIKIQIDFKSKGNYLKVKFWMSSMDESSYGFLQVFYDLYNELKQVDDIELDFSPHYFTEFERVTTKEKEHCISKGKYCSPDQKIGGYGMQSREVILEDIRQIILFDIDKSLWWSYVLRFKKECVDTQDKKINDCSEKVLNTISASNKQISTLKTKFEESFDSKDPEKYGVSENSVMEREKNKQKTQNVSYLPTLILNSEYFRGNVTKSQAIHEFICSFFIDKTPQSCIEKKGEQIEFKNKKEEKIVITIKDTTFPVIILIIISIIIIVFMFIFLYKRMAQREMYGIQNYSDLNENRNQ